MIGSASAAVQINDIRFLRIYPAIGNKSSCRVNWTFAISRCQTHLGFGIPLHIVQNECYNLLRYKLRRPLPGSHSHCREHCDWKQLEAPRKLQQQLFVS